MFGYAPYTVCVCDTIVSETLPIKMWTHILSSIGAQRCQFWFTPTNVWNVQILSIVDDTVPMAMISHRKLNWPDGSVSVRCTCVCALGAQKGCKIVEICALRSEMRNYFELTDPKRYTFLSVLMDFVLKIRMPSHSTINFISLSTTKCNKTKFWCMSKRKYWIELICFIHFPVCMESDRISQKWAGDAIDGIIIMNKFNSLQTKLRRQLEAIASCHRFDYN